MKVINLKKQAKNSRFYSLVSFTRPHEKPWKRKHSSNCFVSQHFFTWEWDQKSIDFHLQWEEESDFLHAVAIQAGQKFRSNLWRKQIFVIFNDCQDMLQNVDEIISQPFPVNWVFNQRLTNFEVGFILQPILDYNQIARLKVSLKVILNSIGRTWKALGSVSVHLSLYQCINPQALILTVSWNQWKSSLSQTWVWTIQVFSSLLLTSSNKHFAVSA